MLTSFEKGIIELIKSSLTGEKPCLDSDFNFELAYQFAQDRQITPLIYYGAMEIDGFMDNVAGKKFFQSTMRLGFYCSNQSNLISMVQKAFRDNKIPHLMLKGTVLRDMYKYPEMRLMSDADILIKEQSYEKIKSIMLECGFEESYESDHELAWKRDDVTIELHKRLIPSYNKDYYDYFGDGWKLATKKNEETNEYFMSDEDSFIYTFVHFAKHYRDAGIGIKHLTDFYVIIKNKPNLDYEYIEKELEKLQLLTFWKNTKKLLDVWFNGEKCDDVSLFMTRKIFGSETFGSYDNHIQSNAVRMSKKGKNVKRRKIISLIFPSYGAMCLRYKFLKKLPVLLPFMWIWRMIASLFKPTKIKTQMRNVDSITQESIDKYQSELNYVGLDFNFE